MMKDGDFDDEDESWIFRYVLIWSATSAKHFSFASTAVDSVVNATLNLASHSKTVLNRRTENVISRITVNKVTLNALYNVNILWPKNVFPETRCISLQCLIHHCDCFQKRWTFEK